MEYEERKKRNAEEGRLWKVFEGSGWVLCGFTRFFARQQREISGWKFSKVYLNWCCGTSPSSPIYIYKNWRRKGRERKTSVKITNSYLHQMWNRVYQVYSMRWRKSCENLLTRFVKKGGRGARKQRYSGREKEYFWDGNVWTKRNTDSGRWPEVISRYVSSNKEFWTRIHPRLLIELERRLSTTRQKKEKKRKET